MFVVFDDFPLLNAFSRLIRMKEEKFLKAKMQRFWYGFSSNKCTKHNVKNNGVLLVYNAN